MELDELNDLLGVPSSKKTPTSVPASANSANLLDFDFDPNAHSTPVQEPLPRASLHEASPVQGPAAPLEDPRLEGVPAVDKDELRRRITGASGSDQHGSKLQHLKRAVFGPLQRMWGAMSGFRERLPECGGQCRERLLSNPRLQQGLIAIVVLAGLAGGYQAVVLFRGDADGFMPAIFRGGSKSDREGSFVEFTSNGEEVGAATEKDAQAVDEQPEDSPRESGRSESPGVVNEQQPEDSPRESGRSESPEATPRRRSAGNAQAFTAASDSEAGDLRVELSALRRSVDSGNKQLLEELAKLRAEVAQLRSSQPSRSSEGSDEIRSSRGRAPPEPSSAEVRDSRRRASEAPGAQEGALPAGFDNIEELPSAYGSTSRRRRSWTPAEEEPKDDAKPAGTSASDIALTKGRAPGEVNWR